MFRLEERLLQMEKLESVASLQEFPRNLWGMQPRVEFVEMSWTKSQGLAGQGCAVYIYTKKKKKE